MIVKDTQAQLQCSLCCTAPLTNVRLSAAASYLKRKPHPFQKIQKICPLHFRVF